MHRKREENVDTSWRQIPTTSRGGRPGNWLSLRRGPGGCRAGVGGRFTTCPFPCLTFLKLLFASSNLISSVAKLSIREDFLNKSVQSYQWDILQLLKCPSLSVVPISRRKSQSSVRPQGACRIWPLVAPLSSPSPRGSNHSGPHPTCSSLTDFASVFPFLNALAPQWPHSSLPIPPPCFSPQHTPQFDTVYVLLTLLIAL